MASRATDGRAGRRILASSAAIVSCLFILGACAVGPQPTADNTLQQTASLIQEVKAFGKSLGIEPTESLSRTTREGPVLSMLWLWLQREGTLALRGPIDVWLAIGFSSAQGQVPLEQVYRVQGYSVYYRQGNEFADDRSVATVGFAAVGIVRRVMIVLHEDLHGDNNFDLQWEIEESIVTPLGSLAAVEFFRQKGDEENLTRALGAVQEQRTYSRELNALVGEAEGIFRTETPENAKAKILELIPNYPTYNRQFERQISGQHPPTVVEAKLSHDLAYYRYFDQIVALWEKNGDLKALIGDLKKLPRDTGQDGLERYLQQLDSRYNRAK